MGVLMDRDECFQFTYVSFNAPASSFANYRPFVCPGPAAQVCSDMWVAGRPIRIQLATFDEQVRGPAFFPVLEALRERAGE